MSPKPMRFEPLPLPNVEAMQVDYDNTKDIELWGNGTPVVTEEDYDHATVAESCPGVISVLCGQNRVEETATVSDWVVRDEFGVWSVWTEEAFDLAYMLVD